MVQLREEAERVLVGAEPAHDFLHVQRVCASARAIALAEHADVLVVEAAATLHELVNLPKNHPDSSRSGELCATAAGALLGRLGANADFTASVCDAILVHAFSAGKAAKSLEAQVLQDADRLDAIGAIGIARCFATCASMGRPFYHFEDPFCEHREPTDKLFGLDHFYNKLLKIPERLNTETGKRLASPRIDYLKGYLSELKRELACLD